MVVLRNPHPTDTYPAPRTNNILSSDDAQWRAVLGRDTQFDGAFVYAVRSTRIYCRPSCPSRKPARTQVVFFPVPEAAESAGFRPCRRCLPRQQPAVDPQVEIVRGICRTIANASTSPTLAQLGEQAGLSPHHLQKIFKRVMGITPRQYAEATRWQDLKAQLKSGHSVTHALYEAGYGSSSRLYEPAASQLGMTPGAYRRGGAELHITYTVTTSPLGLLLAAATHQGVCAVSLGNDADVLRDGLYKEFPHAGIQRDDEALSRWVQDVLRRLEGRLPHAEVPLDLRATAFQKLVWEELKRIPRGKTRSYSQVARAIGRPEAVRAVASACANNPAAVLIPCHRVVRADGSPGGYRWGVARKEALLRQEAVLEEGK